MKPAMKPIRSPPSRGLSPVASHVALIASGKSGKKPSALCAWPPLPVGYDRGIALRSRGLVPVTVPLVQQREHPDVLVVGDRRGDEQDADTRSDEIAAGRRSNRSLIWGNLLALTRLGNVWPHRKSS